MRNNWQRIDEPRCQFHAGTRFHEGTRALAVDDNETSLKLLEPMPLKCQYNEDTNLNVQFTKDQNDENEEEDCGRSNQNPSTKGKPRVLWSLDLHNKFIAAVNYIGIHKAVPKRILEWMNEENLSIDDVASHLQKYRLYLKWISSITSQRDMVFPSRSPDCTQRTVCSPGTLSSAIPVTALNKETLWTKTKSQNDQSCDKVGCLKDLASTLVKEDLITYVATKQKRRHCIHLLATHSGLVPSSENRDDTVVGEQDGTSVG